MLWNDGALCKKFSYEEIDKYWFGERAAERHQAREICASCPVLEQCREFALGEWEQPVVTSYILGGMTGTEIKKRRNGTYKERKQAKPRPNRPRKPPKKRVEKSVRVCPEVKPTLDPIPDGVEVVDVVEAGRMLNLSKAAIRYHIRYGELGVPWKSRGRGNPVYISRDLVENFARRRKAA